MNAATNPVPGYEPDPADLEADVANVFGFNTSDEPEAPSGDPDPAAAPPAPSPPEAKPGGGTEAPEPPPVPAPAAPAKAEPPAALPPLAVPDAAPAPTTPPAETPEDKLKATSLQAQVEALQAEVERLKKPAETPAEPGSGPAEEAPQYGLVIPKEVQDALLSEDGSHNIAAIQHIANGVAVHVHTRVRAEFDKKLMDIRNSLRESEATKTQEEVREQGRKEYFTAFPAHNDPLLQPYVAASAAELAVEFPTAVWGPDYINALGARVNAKLEKLRGAAVPTPPAPPPPAPAPAPKPAASFPSGPRGGIPDFESDADEIASTFSWP